MVKINKNPYQEREFIAILLEIVTPYLKNPTQAERKIVAKRITKTLLGEDIDYIEDQKKIKPPEQKAVFMFKVLKYYSEIMVSLDNMRMISILINQFPNHPSYKIHNITRTRYLRYHLENYLNESYLFKERVESFFDLLQKICQKYGLNKEQKKLNDLRIFSLEGLNNLVITRKHHVHVRRYSDKGTDQLESLDLILKQKDETLKFYEFIKEIEYKKIRLKWKKVVKKNNEELEKLLEIIFENLKDIVFEKICKKINELPRKERRKE